MAVQLNILAMFVSVIVYMILGSLWYSPLLFGKQWMKLTNVKFESVNKKKMIVTYGLTFIFTFIMAFFLEYGIKSFNFKTAMQGWTLGFLIGLGFIATNMAINFLYEKRSIKLYFIYMLYPVIGLGLMGIILTLWP